MENLDFWLCIPGSPRTVASYFKQSRSVQAMHILTCIILAPIDTPFKQTRAHPSNQSHRYRPVRG
jgi:hypothetical protein